MDLSIRTYKVAGKELPQVDANEKVTHRQCSLQRGGVRIKDLPLAPEKILASLAEKAKKENQ